VQVSEGWREFSAGTGILANLPRFEKRQVVLEVQKTGG